MNANNITINYNLAFRTSISLMSICANESQVLSLSAKTVDHF